MDIGELFIKLGVKGTEKTIGAFQELELHLKDAASLSLEAKAGIVGAMYALEQMFAKSGAAGTGLTNFNALTGESVKTLQQYQYAARQVGVSNEETTGTFKGLQDSMSKIKLGQGAPKGFGQVAMLTGGITAADVDKFMKNPELLLQRLQDYAQKEKRVGIRNEALKSFGLSDNMIAAVSRKAFTPNVLNKAPTYSDGEVKQLDKANIAWSNLGNKIEMAIGHFNAAHGGELVKDISMLTDKVLQLANAFVVLAEKLHAFEIIGKIFEGLKILTNAATSTAGGIGKLIDHPVSEGKELRKSAESFIGELPSIFHEAVKSAQETIGVDDISGAANKVGSGIKEIFSDEEKPTVKETTKHLVEKNNRFEKASEKTHGGKESKSTVTNNNRVEKNTEKLGGKESKTILGGKESKTVLGGKESKESKTVLGGKESLRTINNRTNQPNLKVVVPPTNIPSSASAAKPNVGATNHNSVANHNLTVNQNLNFSNDGKDHQKTQNDVKKAVQDAFRQLSSQTQGS